MENVYTICLIAGIVIPLISLILGGIGDLFEGLFGGIFDCLDAIGLDLSVDFLGIDLCILPFSLQCISGAALIFGGTGKLLYNGHNLLFTNIIAGIGAYIMAVLIQTLIHRLKRIEHTTYAKEQLLLFDAKVVHSIVKDGYGSISITTFDGITTEYPAKSENHEFIKQDEIVSIVCFEKNVAIVKRKEEI